MDIKAKINKCINDTDIDGLRLLVDEMFSLGATKYVRYSYLIDTVTVCLDNVALCLGTYGLNDTQFALIIIDNLAILRHISCGNSGQWLCKDIDDENKENILDNLSELVVLAIETKCFRFVWTPLHKQNKSANNFLQKIMMSSQYLTQN